jgi:UPF0716 protein FxsA
MRFFFLFFIAVPLAEMLLLFEVSDQIGGLPTLGLVVATAVIGVQVLKQQGIATLTRANERLSSGELPAQEIIEGMLLAAAGALLLTPGFITDTLGFVFLAGPLRRLIASRLLRSGIVRAAGGSNAGFAKGFGASFGGGFSDAHQEYGAETKAGGQGHRTGDIIEGELVVELVDERKNASEESVEQTEK